VRDALRRNVPAVLLLALVNTAAYVALNRAHFVTPRALPLTALDRALPFWPWTSGPYLLLLFSDLLLPSLLIDRALFRRVVVAMLLSMTINLVLWALIPTVYPRPAAPPSTTWGAGLYNALMGLDTPANCFPSAHISLPTVTCWGVTRQYPRAAAGVWVGFAVLSLSILTTKQHYVADLLGGLVSGALAIASSRWVRAPVLEAAVE
jgi:hypothetical protein